MDDEKMRVVRQGEIYWLDFSPARGSEQRGRRPALIVQNDVGNRYAPTTIVTAITSQISDREYPVDVLLPAGVLPQESEVLCSQVYTVNKSRLEGFVTKLDKHTMRKVDQALKVSLALA